MRRTVLLLVLAASVSASSARAAHVDNLITINSIGGLRLGLTASQYATELGEKAFVTRYGHGRSRLAFAGKVTVLIGADGRGHTISTSEGDYRLKGAIGPCSSIRTLHGIRRGLVERQVSGPFGTIADIFNVGRLWFTIGMPGHIGTVTLADKAPPPATLLGLPQCGTGEEGSKG